MFWRRAMDVPIGICTSPSRVQAAPRRSTWRDHGKPASTQGASGKLTILSGADKTEATLAPAGDNKLEAKGSFKAGPGTKFVTTVTLQGKKPATMRFALK